jgi:ankyrin repeat protein
VEDGMKQLFDPSKPHFAICVWIYDSDFPRLWRRMTRNETPLPLSRTSLHYAASWGLHPVVEFLTIKRPQDVCSRDPTNKNATPLHLASRKGHMKVACKLIERGADLTARDDNGQTPLHLALDRG